MLLSYCIDSGEYSRRAAEDLRIIEENSSKHEYLRRPVGVFYRILQANASTSSSPPLTSPIRQQKQQQQQIESAILREYQVVLKKLLRLATSLNNDVNRQLLVYLELSKLFLLRNDITASKRHLDLAIHNFYLLLFDMSSHLHTASVSSDKFKHFIK